MHSKKRYMLMSFTTIFFVISFAIADIPCFFVEGATGVGKTTFVQLLKQNMYDISVVYEPVETFTNVNGAGNILGLFFGDPTRWTFTTEAYIALMHSKAVEDHLKVTSASTVIVDRSMYADCYVYGKMAFQSGTMNLIEWEVYKQIINVIAKNTSAKPRGFIYLLASPEAALERVRARKRDGEKDVSLQYQNNLNRCYQEWFIQHKDIPDDLAQVPVLVIDASQNFKDDPQIQRECLSQVHSFIKRYSN